MPDLEGEASRPSPGGQIQRLVIAKEVLLPRNVDEKTPEAEAKAKVAEDSQSEQAAATV
jgi:hypothetical protein